MSRAFQRRARSRSAILTPASRSRSGLARSEARSSVSGRSRRQRFTRAAQIARQSGMHAVEMRILNIAVRFGDCSHAARLEELARMLNTPLAEAVAVHARGLANHDGDLAMSRQGCSPIWEQWHSLQTPRPRRPPSTQAKAIGARKWSRPPAHTGSHVNADCVRRQSPPRPARCRSQPRNRDCGARHGRSVQPPDRRSVVRLSTDRGRTPLPDLRQTRHQ